MVNTRGQRVRILLGEINRLAADTTTGLCCVYSFLVPVKGLAVGAVFIRSVALGCHAITPPGHKNNHPGNNPRVVCCACPFGP